MSKGFEAPPPPAGGDKGNTPKDGGAEHAENSLINRMGDHRIEAAKPVESTIDKLTREIAETTKAFADVMKGVTDKHNTLAQLPPDHEFHPNQVLAQYGGEPGSPNQKLLDVAKGKIQPHQVLQA